MILDSVPPNATLSSMLHARAVAATPRRLALDIVLGTAVAAFAAWARMFGWITLLCAGLCFACYGIWAVAERQLETGPSSISVAREYAFTLLRGIAALGGMSALLVMSFSLISVMLGHWIS